ncbi:MAG TPA: hypothetical protein VJL89_06665, partial [Thermodesulfovibrionia bacterium]|nr:hypothetical protein [Thermodesulfovibrionia bacterium]
SVAQCLQDKLGGDIAAVIYTSIARHHGAFTNTLKTSFELIKDANKYIDKSLPFNMLYKCSTKNKPDYVECNEFTDCLLKFQRDEDETLWPLYSFIVRRLRLADQKSQKEVNQ